MTKPLAAGWGVVELATVGSYCGQIMLAVTFTAPFDDFGLARVMFVSTAIFYLPGLAIVWAVVRLALCVRGVQTLTWVPAVTALSVFGVLWMSTTPTVGTVAALAGSCAIWTVLPSCAASVLRDKTGSATRFAE